MNSVTIVRKFRTNRSPTENQPQKRPKRSIDQPRVADAGDRAEPDDHLLVDDQHRDQQQQHPQQAGAVVLAGLRVGRDAAGVVVADHHDQAGADDRQQRQQARARRLRWASSCWLIVPNAPWMSPTCAESSTARSRRLPLGASPVGRSSSSARPPFHASRGHAAARRPEACSGPEIRSGGRADAHDGGREPATSRWFAVLMCTVVTHRVQRFVSRRDLRRCSSVSARGWSRSSRAS